MFRGALAALFLCLGMARELPAQIGIVEAPAAPTTLRAQIGALASEHGFVVRGLDRVGEEEARPVEGDLARQIKTLLADYDYALVWRPGGAVEKVLISGRKQRLATRPSRITVETHRMGAHHVVEAVLVGSGGGRTTVRLVLDTGASTVVLPTSMIAALGYDVADLENAVIQTANGQVEGKRATLRSVDVGGAVVRDVAVSFIDDALMGGVKLLGMSFLRRYRLTIDDDNNLITLIGRP